MSDAPRETRPAARRAWLGPAAAALAAVLTFAVTLGGTYVYDDVGIVLEDPRVADPRLWRYFWTGGYLPGGGGVDRLYRPLTSMTFAVQWWLHGDAPWAFHAVNVALHAAASAAVAALGRRLWEARVGLVAGLLFAVHPVHVEPVAWLVGRSELLCAAATFAGLAISLRPGRLTGRRVAGIVACFLVALLAKEQGLLFPPLLLTLHGVRHPAGVRKGVEDAAPLPPPAGGAPLSSKTHAALLAAALLWGVAGYFLFREAVYPMWWDRSNLDWSMQPMLRSAGFDRWLMPLVLLGRYAALLVAPVRLSVEYGGDVIGSAVRSGEPHVYLGGGVLLAWIVGTVVAARRRAWPAAFCLLAAALTYGMVGNVVALIGTIFGERLIYLPSGFVLLLAAAGFARLPRRVAIPVVALLVALGAARSVAYARAWNDRAAFYVTSLAAQPKSVRLHELVFAEHAKARDWAAARRVAGRCVVEVPHAYEGYLLLAEAALEGGDVDGADAALSAAYARGSGDRGRGLASRIRAERRARAAPATQRTSMAW